MNQKIKENKLKLQEEEQKITLYNNKLTKKASENTIKKSGQRMYDVAQKYKIKLEMKKNEVKEQELMHNSVIKTKRVKSPTNFEYKEVNQINELLSKNKKESKNNNNNNKTDKFISNSKESKDKKDISKKDKREINKDSIDSKFKDCKESNFLELEKINSNKCKYILLK